MSLGAIITIILLIIKVTDHGDPSWFQVFLPMIIEFGIYIFVWLLTAIVALVSVSRR